ncbi:MAG TPA: hypothetical protein VHB21_03940, partial [Minicystis sp.]|nr:hypothetical protein [Minicystis sp.]
MPLPDRLAPALRHLSARAAWAGGAAALGLFVRCAAPAPPARTVEGVAAMLGSAVGGEVRPEDFVWEERHGFLADAFLGRRVLFLARTGPGGRDLFRARVRLTRAGRPVSVLDVHDLTDSPLGDDGGLVARGREVAYVTRAFGAVQGVTLLDLAGAREAPSSVGERARAAIDRWFTTGSARGLARTEVVFERPPVEAKIEIEGDLLVMALGDPPVPAALDARKVALDTGEKDPFGAHAHAVPSPAPRWSGLVVSRARALFGEGAARGVESALLALSGALARRAADLPPPTGAPVAAADDGFPPPGVAWRAPSAPEGLVSPPGDGAPPSFVEGSIEADTAHGARTVRLVALDTRRLDVGFEAGPDAPRSATGVHGIGRVPERVAGRVVAVFATGPADARLAPAAAVSSLGVVVDRAPLVPPSPGAAAIAFGVDGAVRLGAWPERRTLPDWLASLRQTPDALAGTAPPRVPLEGADRRARRSALCLMPSGHLVVAVAHAIDGASLGRALARVGCASSLPLAAAPADVGFAYVRRRAGVAPDAPDAWTVAPIDPGGGLDATRLARGMRGDFAYVLARDARPSAPLPAGSAWTPDGGKQPAPSFLPGVFTASSTELGAQVHLTAFAPGRFSFRIRAGHRELANKLGGTFATELAADEQAHALAAVGLGDGRRKTARGLATGGAVGLRFR